VPETGRLCPAAWVGTGARIGIGQATSTLPVSAGDVTRGRRRPGHRVKSMPESYMRTERSVPSLEEGRQRVGTLREVPLVLRELGADPDSVFQDAGLQPRILDNPDNEITFVTMGRLLQACVRATGCEHFGLLAGSRLTLRSLGIVGELMASAPRVGQALWDLVHTQGLNAHGAVC